MGEWSSVYGSGATKRKVYVAKVNKYFSKLGVAEMYQETNAGFNEGDDLIIVGPTTGVVEVKASGMRVADQIVNHVSRGTVFSMKVPCKVRPSDKIYKMEDVK